MGAFGLALGLHFCLFSSALAFPATKIYVTTSILLDGVANGTGSSILVNPGLAIPLTAQLLPSDREILEQIQSLQTQLEGLKVKLVASYGPTDGPDLQPPQQYGPVSSKYVLGAGSGTSFVQNPLNQEVMEEKPMRNTDEQGTVDLKMVELFRHRNFSGSALKIKFECEDPTDPCCQSLSGQFESAGSGIFHTLVKMCTVEDCDGDEQAAIPYGPEPSAIVKSPMQVMDFSLAVYKSVGLLVR